MLFLELIVFKKFVLIMNYVFLQIHQKG
jgi:hypothetical protein